MNMVNIMIYEITFRESRGEGVNTFTVDASNDIEAVRLLGFYQGKRAVKHIVRVESMGRPDEQAPAGVPRGL